MKILGIIPARGGSKGIPHKNIVTVGGKPLIQYSIDLGLKAIAEGLIDRCVVSTDDEGIAQIARDLGGDVPFLRPAEIANDTAKSIDFMIHALDFLHKSGQSFDAVLLLQPTSPLRSLEDVRNIVQRFESGRSESLISVYREDHVHALVSYHDDDGLGIPLDENHNKGVRRQEHKPIYVRNGAFYLTLTDYLVREHKVFSDRPIFYVMSKALSVNLDGPDDLELLNKILG